MKTTLHWWASFRITSPTSLHQYTGSEDECDSDGADNVAIRQENAYYNGKALRDSDPAASLRLLAEVLELEESKDEWGFRALKQMMKLYFKQVQHVLT